MNYLRLLAAWIVLLLTTNDALSADSWPEWRGPQGSGVSQAVNLPTSWSETSHIAWRVIVPGHGWSVPVIGNQQVWVTTGIDQPASEKDATRRRKASTNSQPLTVSDSVSLRAVGLDLATGKLLHNKEVLSQSTPQMIHRENSYATPTPILDNNRLYCHYGPYGIACLDLNTQKVIWENRSLQVKHENGPGSSPILWKNLLIIHCDGIDQQYIVALNTADGKPVWKTARSGKPHEDVQMRKAYSTSLIVDIDGTQQVVSPAADWVYGYDPRSGKELWKLSYGKLGFSNAPRPIAGHGLVYVCTGYMKSELMALRLSGRSETSAPEVAWRFKRGVPNVSSPLLVGDAIYFASDNGIATCIDAKSGKLHWSQRIGKRFWASPLYADGRIYFFDYDGVTTVIQPGISFHKLAVNRLDGTLLTSAAVVDGSLLLRTSQALYCIRP